MIENALNYIVGLIQRLATTIPTSCKHTSYTQQLSQLYSNATTSESLYDLLILTVAVVLALELVSNATYHVPKAFVKTIPVRGKHLDLFSVKDWAFISFNKVLTGTFVYLYYGYLWSVRKQHMGHGHNEHSLEHGCCGGGKGIWRLEDLSLTNTILPIPVLFVVYDFFYTLLHWFLHIKAIYTYVHKHHHHQKAPSRANIDAVNVHPLEFFLGEFNHILAMHLVVKGMPLLGFQGMDVSWLAATLFIGLGGILAGLNHTRHDVAIANKKSGWTLYDSKHHDVHHRIPQSNYGQYTVLWDRVFGTFREYDQNDRVNPAYQLDPRTGMSIGSDKKD